jgi:hypothetical protein
VKAVDFDGFVMQITIASSQHFAQLKRTIYQKRSKMFGCG